MSGLSDPIGKPAPPPPRYFAKTNFVGIGAMLLRFVVGEILFFRLALAGPALQALLFGAVIWLALGDAVPEVLGLPFLEFLVPGLIITAMAQRAFENTAYSIVYEKMEGTIVDVFGAPLSSGEILIGYMTSSIMVSILIGLSVWLILLPLAGGLPAHPFILVAFIIFGSGLFCLIGLLSGVRSRRWDALSAIETFALAPLLFLSGSFFSIDQLSEPFRSLMLANPVFHLVNGFRFAMTGVADAPPLISFAILSVLVAALFFVALYVLEKGYRIKA